MSTSDFQYCSNCEEEPGSPSYPRHDGDDPSCDPWKRPHSGKRWDCDHFLCSACHARQEYDNADGPSDDDLSVFYGGGGACPMSEQYAESAKQKRSLR